MVFRVRDRFDFVFPVIRASSSREPGACSAITRSTSRLPADSTLAKDSVEVNHTFGSSGAMRCLPRATARVRALHILVAGDAYFQRGHGITPFSRNTESTVVQKSPSSVAASRYS